MSRRESLARAIEGQLYASILSYAMKSTGLQKSRGRLLSFLQAFTIVGNPLSPTGRHTCPLQPPHHEQHKPHTPYKSSRPSPPRPSRKYPLASAAPRSSPPYNPLYKPSYH